LHYASLLLFRWCCVLSPTASLTRQYFDAVDAFSDCEIDRRHFGTHASSAMARLDGFDSHLRMPMIYFDALLGFSLRRRCEISAVQE